MSSGTALLVYLALISVMLIIDSRRRFKNSAALWIPSIWTAILASKPISSWVNGGHSELSAAVEDGNPLDRAILSVLIAAAAYVLFRRKLNWGRLLRENIWLAIFFLYCGISILWSDFPDVALKRLIRAMGGLMVILVVLSEEDPIAAVGTVLRRCAYVLVPISMLLIKYYRNIGVEYDTWTGSLLFVGVGTNKNGLGRLCLVAGVLGVWDIITTWRDDRVNLLNRGVSIFMTALTVWLLVQSHSATSLAAFVVGTGIIVTLGLPPLRNNVRYLGTLVLIATAFVVIAGLSNLIEATVAGLGRNMTFTTRTAIWADLLALHTNPIVGVGYDSFWLGDRLDFFVRKYDINEAHSGYLEVYLDLGAIGLGLLACLALKMFYDAKRLMIQNFTFDYGRLRIAMLVIFALYNVTEAAYKTTSLMFFVLLLIAIRPPVDLQPQQLVTPPPQAPDPNKIKRPAEWRPKRPASPVGPATPPSMGFPTGLAP
jgi:exopolysaccharide production protein ExoQ